MHPDEELLRANFEATNRGDYVRVGADYDEHVVLVAFANSPGSEVRYGWRDVNRWFADWMSTFGGGVRFDDFEVEVGRNALAATPFTRRAVVRVVSRSPHGSRGRTGSARARSSAWRSTRPWMKPVPLPASPDRG